jgi:hypothetical protein
MTMFSNYDTWKLRSPDDERSMYDPYDEGEEHEPFCQECNNTGWVIEGDVADRCLACCYQPLDIDDLEEMAGGDV